MSLDQVLTELTENTDPQNTDLLLIVDDPASAPETQKVTVDTFRASDPNRLTADQKAALAGTNGTPSATNKYVTDSDSRNTNARTPTAHATTHAAAGSDPLSLSWTQVDKTGSSLADLAARSASDLSSGTLPQARKWTEATITSTGNLDDLNFSNADLVRMNNASLATIRGLAAGVAGQRVVIVSVGTGQVDLAHQNTNSSAANRLVNMATCGNTPLAAGRGSCSYVYDGTTQRWRLADHEQGEFIAETFDSSRFGGNGSMTWTVDSGDVQDLRWYLAGAILTVHFNLAQTSVGGTVNTELRWTLPNGWTAASTLQLPYIGGDNGTVAVKSGGTLTNGNYLRFHNVLNPPGANWTSSTNNTIVRGDFVVTVQ